MLSKNVSAGRELLACYLHVTLQHCSKRLPWEGPLEVYCCMMCDPSDAPPNPEVALHTILAEGCSLGNPVKPCKHDRQCSSAVRAGHEPPATSSNEEEDDQADLLEQAARSASQQATAVVLSSAK